MIRKVLILFIGILFFNNVSAQIEQDTIENNEIQNPEYVLEDDTTAQYKIDSIALAREKFIQDSIAFAREMFIKDSLFRRKQILDSVTFLKNELPILIEAAIKSINEEILIYTDEVEIIGDSILSDYTYRILSQKVGKPYAPWRTTLKLSGKKFRLRIDTVDKQVLSLYSPQLNFSFDYSKNKKIIVLRGRSAILKKKTGNFYKFPIDSVFLDYSGRIKMIKKYYHYYQASKDYKKGASAGIDIDQIKEFDYFADGALSRYKLINYCDRWSSKNKNKQCFIVNYTLSREGMNFKVKKENDPPNAYADGTYFYEFDDNFDMKLMEFKNGQKDLNKKCFIELNDDKLVKRYLYEKNGRIFKTILVHYFDDPNLDYKYETIMCLFEDDNICYFQKNERTNKRRKRDKLTMEWGPWQ